MGIGRVVDKAKGHRDTIIMGHCVFVLEREREREREREKAVM